MTLLRQKAPFAQHAISRLNLPGNRVEIDDLGLVPRGADEVANQFQRLKLGIGRQEARGVRQKIVNCFVLDRPCDSPSDGLEKILERPTAAAKRADIADRIHRDFN